MKFNAFQIKNYKSFIDSGKCPVENGVTIFAGQNESGKTNILDALTKINSVEPEFEENEYSFGNDNTSPEINYWFSLESNELSALNDEYPNSVFDNEIEVHVFDGHRMISCKHFENEQNKEVEDNSEDVEDVEENYKEVMEENIQNILSDFLPKFVLYKTLKDKLPDTFTNNDLKTTPIKRLSKYLNKDFSTIFTESNHQKQRNDTNSLSKQVSDDFSTKYHQRDIKLSFDINDKKITLYVEDVNTKDVRGYAFLLSQRSEGLQWYLNFYIALKGEDLREGDIILVDEPGMYLHPKAQEEMREILCDESKKNQILYSTHSPYLINAKMLNQIRLVEKHGTKTGEYNEISTITDRIHSAANVDTLKPITDAIGYSIGSELHLQHKKLLICEGVSDYYYIRSLEKLFNINLDCGITHANGCDNIEKITLLYLGLGITDIYALADSDKKGLCVRTKLINDGMFDEEHFLTTHGTTVNSKEIEDIFNKEWYLKEILKYDESKINCTTNSISKEVKIEPGCSKYVLAKELYNMTRFGLEKKDVLDDSGFSLWENLTVALGVR